MRETYLSIGEFAKLTSISRRNLLFYDECGVLQPEYINEKGYRFYSLLQMDEACLVTTLRELGVPLKEIKGYHDQRSPETMLEVFRQQKVGILGKIQKLEGILALLEYRMDTIQRFQDVDTQVVSVLRCPEESVYYSEPITQPTGSLVEQITRFYFECKDKNCRLGYTVGRSVSPAALMARDWERTERLYYKEPQSSGRKPAGLYVTGFQRCYYGQSAPLYEKLMAFIETHALQIAGGSYEEHLLNELCIVDPSDYLMRIQIPVEETPAARNLEKTEQ